MEQNNEELNWRNWRNPEWRDRFFNDFIQELRFCQRENIESNLQNTEMYNNTRHRCQFILDLYLTMLGHIVSEIEDTETPRDVVESIIHRLQEDLITHNIFEGIVDQTTERIIHEDFNELQVINPMLQGNNQEWSELSLVNHFNRLYSYYMRLIQYINRENNAAVNVGGRGRKKYRKSKKGRKTRKNKKPRSRKQKTKSNKREK